VRGDQLSLAVQLPQACNFESFVAEHDLQAVSQLKIGESAYLHGATGVGKTHLLLAACRAHVGRYVPLSSLLGESTEALTGLATDQPLALDELESAPQNPEFWMALLRLLDQRAACNAVTWIASRTAPDALLYLPADLKTRLARLPRFHVPALNELQQFQLLIESAERRGLALPEDVIRWWLRHLPRDAGSLLAGLERIDRASLKARRRLTLPFVQAVLTAPDQATDTL
jgi:DnaA-homolog protein